MQITMSLVRVVVDAAVEVSVALEMLGDAKRVVDTAEVMRLIALARRLYFSPDGSEATSTGQFVGRSKPDDEGDERHVTI